MSFLLNGCAEIPATDRAPALRQMRVRTTAYTHTEPGGSKSAIGTRLRFDSATTSAAADWSWMPVGTRFRILPDGREYVIEDYGSGLIGKKTIDLYMPDQSSMRQWGVRTVEIEIIEWGSRAVSKMLLAKAGSSSKVQRMLASLDDKHEP
ncbi:MAG: 3D domain-containing protein [Verrucomicrobiota bacterium]